MRVNNELQIFKYNDVDVRTVMRDGNPWWVLKEVCDILEIGNSRMVADRLDDDEKGVSLIDTPGGKQEMTVINEPGIYNVIFRSDKPEAKNFKRWITHEVLPAIRKTGAYVAPGAMPMDNLETLAQGFMTANKALTDALKAIPSSARTVNNLQRIYEKRKTIQDVANFTGAARRTVTRYVQKAGWTKLGVRTFLCESQIAILIEAMKTPSPSKTITYLTNRRGNHEKGQGSFRDRRAGRLFDV